MSDIPDPKTWATGGEPATEKQKRFLGALASEKGIDIDVEEVDKSTACAKIDELKNGTSTSSDTTPISSSAKGSDAVDTSAVPTNPDEIQKKEQSDEPITESSDPATDKQKRYLAVLEDGNHDDLTKEEASRRISELK